MGQNPNIDPRLAPYTAAKIDYTDPKSCPETQMDELSTMVRKPQPNAADNGLNNSIKLLFPQIMNDEKIIDYRKDNSKDPNGFSDSTEWAALLMAATHYAKNHPNMALQLQPSGYGPELDQVTLAAIVKEGSVIFKRYDDLKRADALLHPQVTVTETSKKKSVER